MRIDSIPLQRLIGAAALALAMVLSGCSSKEDRVSEHLKKSRDFYAKQDFDKAQVEARNAVQIDPKRAEGYYIAAQVDEFKQDWQKAFGGYQKVIELEPGHAEAKIRVARLYLAARDTANAEKRVNEVLAINANNLDAVSVQAALLAQTGELGAAIEKASAVVAKQPGHTEAAGLLTNLLVRRGEVAKAQTVIEQALAANPGSSELRVVYGAILSRIGDRAKTEENFIKMIELNPKRFENRAALALFHVQGKQPERAEKVLRDAIDADPSDDQRYIAMTDFLISRSGGEAGERELLAQIAKRPKAVALKFKLAQLYNQTAQAEKSTRIYQELIADEKTGPNGLQARIQLAANEALAGRRDQAETLVAQVLKENPRDNRALVFRAQLALAKKDPASAIVDLRSVLKDQPGSMEVVALLANAHRLNREPELGRDVITSAIKLYPNSTDLRLLNADYLNSIGDKDAAIREVDDVVRHNPKLTRAYEVKAALHGANKDVAGAERTFTALKTALPDDAIGPYRLGLVYAAQQKHGLAIPEFELALRRAPNSREPMSALVSSYAAIGKLELAATRAGELAKAQPDNFVPTLILGDVYTAMKRFPEAEAAFGRAVEIQPKAAGAYLGLSRMRSAQKDYSKAAAELERGLKVIPDDFGLALALAEVHQRNGDNARALTEYEGLLKRYPSNDVIANNLAYLLGEAKGDRASLDRALLLAKRFESSTNPSFLDTLGWLYVKRGSLAEGLPLLRKAYDQIPQAPNYQYHLGAALLNGGESREGKDLVRRALESQPEAEWAAEAKKLLAAR